MSDDRKYKQRGYQDHESGPRGSAPSTPGMPRTRVVTSYRETIRCGQCGADLSTLFDVKEESLCPKCRAALHSCRNCHHFDTSARFECARPVGKRISDKAASNRCPLFSIRIVSVKDIGGSSPTRAEDARKALESLFKK